MHDARNHMQPQTPSRSTLKLARGVSTTNWSYRYCGIPVSVELSTTVYDSSESRKHVIVTTNSIPKLDKFASPGKIPANLKFARHKSMQIRWIQ